MVYGALCMAYGAWCMVHCVWCMVQCMVHGAMYGAMYGAWCNVLRGHCSSSGSVIGRRPVNTQGAEYKYQQLEILTTGGLQILTEKG